MPGGRAASGRPHIRDPQVRPLRRGPSLREALPERGSHLHQGKGVSMDQGGPLDGATAFLCASGHGFSRDLLLLQRRQPRPVLSDGRPAEHLRHRADRSGVSCGRPGDLPSDRLLQPFLLRLDLSVRLRAGPGGPDHPEEVRSAGLPQNPDGQVRHPGRGRGRERGLRLPGVLHRLPDRDPVPLLRPAGDVPGRGDGDRAAAGRPGAHGTPELVPILLPRGGAAGPLREVAPAEDRDRRQEVQEILLRPVRGGLPHGHHRCGSTAGGDLAGYSDDRMHRLPALRGPLPLRCSEDPFPLAEGRSRGGDLGECP